MVEPEVDEGGIFIDDAIEASEFVDAPVKLIDLCRKPSSTSRAAETATTHIYYNISLAGAADSVGMVEQKHGKSKSSDVVRFDACASVGPEVTASAIAGPEDQLRIKGILAGTRDRGMPA